MPVRKSKLFSSVPFSDTRHACPHTGTPHILPVGCELYDKTGGGGGGGGGRILLTYFVICFWNPKPGHGRNCRGINREMGGGVEGGWSRVGGGGEWRGGGVELGGGGVEAKAELSSRKAEG